MIAGMDALHEQELHENVEGLGNFHEVEKGKRQYLVNDKEVVVCLKDILIALRQDTPQQGYLVHLKLGEWKTLPNHLVPLFVSYRQVPEIAVPVLKVIMELTSHVEVHPSNQPLLLRYLQDYKEAFVKKDVFIIVMGMLVESMDAMDEEEESNKDKPEREKESEKPAAEDILKLLANLISTPDPQPGDAGFTPMRKTLQLSYIRHFHENGMFDFFLLFAEQMESDRKEDQAWWLLEILYHIMAQVDPEGIVNTRKEKDRKVLAELLSRDQAHARINRTQSSRHARFGTTMTKRDGLGGVSNSASMHEPGRASKGTRMWHRDFRNMEGSDRKKNMSHDPFFVDLSEGSVRDHDQINPYVKQAHETSNDLGEGILGGLRKFFEEFVQTAFSPMVSYARGTVLQTEKVTGSGYRLGELPPHSSRKYGRQQLLNFISWILEFHRHHHFGEASRAKENKTPVSAMDVSSIQGALDLDMIQFVTARLREYGKEANIHSSFLVLVLRALCQQVKTIGVVLDSQDAEIRDCGEILIKNILKEDVMSQLCWIMKNYKSSSHDPRVLSYTVEIFHHMTRLMKKVMDMHKQDAAKVEFEVDRVYGRQLRRAVTSVSAEIESLADANVVENLFHLLEKYKRHSPQLNSMLVKLIYSIMKAHDANIVVFFELSYFVRIHRIWSDPLIRDRKEGKKYAEMVELLRFILRQFFKCAERNQCVFAELLFRKTFAKQKDAVMEDHATEFQAILDNYEDEGYAQFLDRMRHGDTFEVMRARQRQLLSGSLPWTEEEDAVLRERYHVHMDHPLCMDLLAAELPEDSRRNAKGVKARLAELGLLQTKASRSIEEVAADDGVGIDVPEESPSKKAKVGEDEFDMDMSLFEAGDDIDIDSLEKDLEKLLEAEESRRVDVNVPPQSSSSSSSGLPASSLGVNPAPTAVDPSAETQPGDDLELELEAMLDESGQADSLEQDLDTLIGNSQPQASQNEGAGTGSTLEDDLAGLLEESGVRTQSTPPAATAPDVSPSKDTQDEEQFWDDAVLGASPVKQLGSAPEIPATQACQEPTLEETLEDMLEAGIDESI